MTQHREDLVMCRKGELLTQCARMNGGGADPKWEGWADVHHMWRKAGTPAALALGDGWIYGRYLFASV